MNQEQKKSLKLIRQHLRSASVEKNKVASNLFLGKCFEIIDELINAKGT